MAVRKPVKNTENFLLQFAQACILAAECGEEVYMADDESGYWSTLRSDSDEGAPSVLLAISPGGFIRLVDNSTDGNIEEEWRR